MPWLLVRCAFTDTQEVCSRKGIKSSHPQSLSHFFLLPTRKHTLLMGTAKRKVTPETTELFWGDEADNDMQSRSSIVILFYFLKFFSFIFLAPQIFSAIKCTWFPRSSSLARDLLIPQQLREPLWQQSLLFWSLLHCSPLMLGPNPEPAQVEVLLADSGWRLVLRLTAYFIALVSGGIFQSACLVYVYVTEQEKLHRWLYPLHDIT